MTIQTAFVFWHATAVPKPKITVFPPNPKLAKLSIQPIEPIDEVDGPLNQGHARLLLQDPQLCILVALNQFQVERKLRF
jgi:hypothetical protein